MKTEQTPKHTPGPWEVIKNIHCDYIISANDIICEIDWTSDDAKANAELIAQAPTLKALNEELLEALEPLNKLADQCLDNSNLDKDQVVYAYNRAQITMSDLRKVRALISKCKDL